MEISQIIAEIKKYGKTTYVAEKGEAIVKNFNQETRQLGLFIPSNPPISIYEKPLSLLGGISICRSGEDWPSFEEKPLMPILQITANKLPIFKKLFGDDEKLVTVYCPEKAINIGDRWVAEIKEYSLSEPLVKLSIPKGIPQEKDMYTINWKKHVDYPSNNLFELFYPPELAQAIRKQLEDEYGSEYYSDNFPTAEGTKLGGYPYCIQGEPDPWFNNLLKPDLIKGTEHWEFIMQIDQHDFKRLNLVHSGIMMVFRNKQTKEWVCDLQFF